MKTEEYKHKGFVELEDMCISDLIDQKQRVLNAIDEKRKERCAVIGQVLFYQELLKERS